MNKEYLLNYLKNYYKSSDNLILLDGPWGSGKTYLLNEFMKSFNKCKVIYLSLLGKRSVDEINTSLFMEINHKHIVDSLVPSAINPLLYLENNKNNLDFSLKINNDNPSAIVILDDLERYASSDFDTLISYCQNLIRSNAKVIIVSNISELGGGTRHNFELSLEKAFDRILYAELFTDNLIKLKYPNLFKYLDEYLISLINNNYRVFEKCNYLFTYLINKYNNEFLKISTNCRDFYKILLFYVINIIKYGYRDPFIRYELIKDHIDYKIEGEVNNIINNPKAANEIKVILDYCLNYNKNDNMIYQLKDEYQLITAIYMEYFYLNDTFMKDLLQKY